MSETKPVHPRQGLSTSHSRHEFETVDAKTNKKFKVKTWGSNSNDSIPVKACYTRESNLTYRDGGSKQKQPQIQPGRWLQHRRQWQTSRRRRRATRGATVRHIFFMLLFWVLEYIHLFVAMTVSRLKSFLLSIHFNKSNTCWICLDANQLAKISKLIHYSVLCVMPHLTSIW